jgi:GTPase Era involved in 16S rRNA processing
VALIGRPQRRQINSVESPRRRKESPPSQTNRKQRATHKRVVSRPRCADSFDDTPGVHKPGHLLNRLMIALMHELPSSTVDLIVCNA